MARSRKKSSSGKRRSTDAFISHSSANAAEADRVRRALEDDGLTVWLDRSDIRAGQLLRKELRAALDDSRVVVLVWSKAAAKSRWVASEILTAFHLGRFVIACVCDKTPLPYFLQNTIHLNFEPRKTGWVQYLRRAIREAPNAANDVPIRIGGSTAVLDRTIRVLAQRQVDVLTMADRGDLKGARKAQLGLDGGMKAAEKKWSLEAMVLNLAGYHRKNAYLLKNWDAISAGRPPQDRLLERSEGFFYKSLFADPYDFSALNGLGSILFYEREIDAAEFFIRRALALAKKARVDYSAAKQDLQLMLATRAHDPRQSAA
jgi:hypothetical protein